MLEDGTVKGKDDRTCVAVCSMKIPEVLMAMETSKSSIRITINTKVHGRLEYQVLV